MAAAELPSFYGQKTNDGTTIRRPSKTKKLTPNASAIDMASSPNNNNRESTASTQFGHSFQEKTINESANDATQHPALRKRRIPSDSSPSSKASPPRRSSRRQRSRRRDYGGRHQDEDDESDEDSDSMDSEEWRHHHRRRHIRRKLKAKHEADVIPLRIPWTKWMHSDAKNRMSLPILLFLHGIF